MLKDVRNEVPTRQGARLWSYPYGLGMEPFPTALREAIDASGLTLDRIQHRLQLRGVQLSVATLSYWQSGRRRPERPRSMQALKHLESILNLAPDSLSSLLGPPRIRGRHVGNDGSNAVTLWDPVAGAEDVLAAVDTSNAHRLRRLSQRDHVFVGRNRSIQRVRSQLVLRAECSGLDRWVAIHEWERGPLESRAMFSNLRNCRIGAVQTHRESGLTAVELLFDRPLRRGETVLIEYETANPLAQEPWLARTDHFQRRFSLPSGEYLLEITFDQAMKPLVCQQFSRHDADVPAQRSAPLSTSTSNSTHAFVSNFAHGKFGITWEWPH